MTVRPLTADPCAAQGVSADNIAVTCFRTWGHTGLHYNGRVWFDREVTFDAAGYTHFVGRTKKEEFSDRG